MAASILKWFIVLLFIIVCPLFANTEEEPIAEKLRDTFQKPYLSLGFVLQVVADGQVERTFPGNNGFNISNMRIVLSGELDKQFGYLLRTNFINATSVLDAKIYLRFTENTAFHAGLFKSPFSKEFLTGAESIDMVNRSQVVSALAPGRQIGMQISHKAGALSFDGGIFNGNGFAGNNNDNDDFMFAGRLGIKPELTNGKLDAGINAAFSKDDAVNIISERFSGERTLAGIDFRLEIEKALLAGEYIYSKLADDRFGISDSNPKGYHLTGGYMLTNTSQLLVRWDYFNPDRSYGDSQFLLFGYNLWPTSLTELQVNYIINTDDSAFDHHQLLINFQVAF